MRPAKCRIIRRTTTTAPHVALADRPAPSGRAAPADHPAPSVRKFVHAHREETAPAQPAPAAPLTLAQRAFLRDVEHRVRAFEPSGHEAAALSRDLAAYERLRLAAVRYVAALPGETQGGNSARARAAADAAEAAALELRAAAHFLAATDSHTWLLFSSRSDGAPGPAVRANGADVVAMLPRLRQVAKESGYRLTLQAPKAIERRWFCFHDGNRIGWENAETREVGAAAHAAAVALERRHAKVRRRSERLVAATRCRRARS